jgi:CubicO group peptidase (beta-lactamase class C family)
MMKLGLFLFFTLTLNSYAASFQQTTKLMDQAFKSKLFSGASLFVGNAEVAHLEYSVGESDSGKIFDIASLSKVVATTIAVMILEERGQIALTDKVSKYFPAFSSTEKKDVTIEDLLRHRAGLPAGSTPKTGEAFDIYLKRITSAALNYKPRSQTVYSDLSFVLLGRIVEIVSGKSLANFAQKNIFSPLKMLNTSYVVSEENLLRCMPTSSLLNCLVHDPTAFRLLPESVGNAGVFSNLEDLIRLGRMLLNKGELDGVRILSEKTFTKMTTPDGPRGLGWDFTSAYSSAPRGSVFPAGISFGHTGYTGTTMWIDPKSMNFYVFLSNRVYMGDERTKKPFTAFRKALSSAIGAALY